jgi:hypothetical protein
MTIDADTIKSCQFLCTRISGGNLFHRNTRYTTHAPSIPTTINTIRIFCNCKGLLYPSRHQSSRHRCHPEGKCSCRLISCSFYFHSVFQLPCHASGHPAHDVDEKPLPSPPNNLKIRTCTRVCPVSLSEDETLTYSQLYKRVRRNVNYPLHEGNSRHHNSKASRPRTACSMIADTSLHHSCL